jgi:hypothetical protein
MTPDDRKREAEHADSCWDGCDDLHPDECDECSNPLCEGDCADDAPPTPRLVTKYGLEERGRL